MPHAPRHTHRHGNVLHEGDVLELEGGPNGFLPGVEWHVVQWSRTHEGILRVLLQGPDRQRVHIALDETVKILKWESKGQLVYADD